MNGNDARTIANRENARKSTGPRTAEGKARSRANAFKHGLAGEGVAFPGELAGEMQRFVDGQVAAEPVRPRDDREQMLVEKVARISWLVDRAERAEEAQAIIRASEAERGVRRKRREEVAELVAMIATDPSWAMEELLELKKGCEWAIGALREMIDAVDADWWMPAMDERLDAICAPAEPGRLRMTRAKALALALGSANYDAIWPNGAPGLDPLEPDAGPEASLAWTELRAEIVREMRPKWRADLRDILARRLAEVERRLDELDAHPDAALIHAAVAATFDLSEPSERLRRFIRSKERERRYLLAELAEHRTLRDEHPNECEPSSYPDTTAAPAPPPPLAPPEEPPGSAGNPERHGLNPPRVAENWLRSGTLEPDGSVRPARGTEPGMRASG